MHAGNTDTIAAIATARGRAALAIVRLSGPEARTIASRCFRGRDLRTVPSHTAHVGYAVDAAGNDIDQVVVTVFRAPRSATGEDVVEITCHGGDFAPQLILRALLEAGARLAEPGEFTQRAFLNGKLDLTQAEAVADLIHARSTLAHRVSLKQLQGRYAETIGALRQELLSVVALVELELDFTEEDVEFADRAHLGALLDRTAALLKRLLSTQRLGAWLRDGVRVVIGGRPNAGKSTLLNALLERDRAIVSEIPGTTRDEIEAEIELEGITFQLVDTAGLRQTSDVIEAEGVRRTQQAIEQSDALIYVFDLRVGLDEEEERFLQEIVDRDMHILLLGNKRDLVVDPVLPDTSYPCVAISAQEAKENREELTPVKEWLVSTVAADLATAEASPVLMNQRHRRHLERALEAVCHARAALAEGLSGDLLALDLRTALHELGAITGEITTEDVLDEIFSNFCIGK